MNRSISPDPVVVHDCDEVSLCQRVWSLSLSFFNLERAWDKFLSLVELWDILISPFVESVNLKIVELFYDQAIA